MPLRRTHPRATAATPPASSDPVDPAVRSPSVRASTLLLMTSLGAIDGTILLLAAQGTLSTLGGALVTGLTVIGGAGAWITARQSFGHRHRLGDHLLLVGIAVLGGAAAVASAALGAWIGANVELQVLPKAVGAVLMLVAAEVGGIRLPHLVGLPLPFAGVVLAVILEALQWML